MLSYLLVGNFKGELLCLRMVEQLMNSEVIRFSQESIQLLMDRGIEVRLSALFRLRLSADTLEYSTTTLLKLTIASRSSQFPILFALPSPRPDSMLPLQHSRRGYLDQNRLQRTSEGLDEASCEGKDDSARDHSCELGELNTCSFSLCIRLP